MKAKNIVIMGTNAGDNVVTGGGGSGKVTGGWVSTPVSAITERFLG